MKTIKFEIPASKLEISDLQQELNKRAKSYVGWNDMSICQAQDRAMEDFGKYLHGGEYVRLSADEVRQSEGVEFFRRTKLPQKKAAK